MIENILLHFKTYEEFRRHLDVLKDIKYDSIVFIQDRKIVWTHGTEYACSKEEPVYDSIFELLDNKADKTSFKTLTTSKYRQLINNNQIEPNVYYFTYEGDDEEEYTEWTFGNEFPVIFTGNTINTIWKFGDRFPITLTSGTIDGIGKFPINLV